MWVTKKITLMNLTVNQDGKMFYNSLLHSILKDDQKDIIKEYKDTYSNDTDEYNKMKKEVKKILE